MKMIVTAAGRQALVNAEQTGTAPVVISKIGVGTGKYTATDSQTALVAETKRLPIVEGGSAGANSIHVAYQDASTDAYAVHEIGLFLEDGTLFAVTSQTAAILQKSATATALLVIDIVFTDIDVSSIAFGDVTFTNPAASQDNAGVVAIATDDEVAEGANTQKVVTPAGLLKRTATVTRTGLVELATDDEGKAGTDASRAMTPASTKAAIDARVATSTQTIEGQSSTLFVTPVALKALTATTARVGLVELATEEEGKAGTDTYRAVTAAVVKAIVTDATPSSSETKSGLVILATSDEVIAGTNTTKAITPAGLSAKTATTSRLGLVQLATTTEANAGTATDKAMTPAGTKAAITQATPVASETVKGLVELATSEEVLTGTSTTQAVTPAGLAARTATVDRAGIIKLATEAEAKAGTVTDKATSPATVKAAIVQATPNASEAQKGLVQLATNTEATTGTDTLKAVTPAGLKAALGGVYFLDGNIINADGQPLSVYPGGLSGYFQGKVGVNQMTNGRFSDDAGGSSYAFYKSRSTDLSQSKIVQPNDIIGVLNFIADNGKVDVTGENVGARVAYITVNVADTADLPEAGTDNIGMRGIMRLVVCEDGASRSGKGVEIAPEAFRPTADNNISLGGSGRRFTSLYSTNGTIQTSDARFKDDIAPVDDRVLDAWSQVNFSQFKFKNGVSIHVGVIAQQVDKAFKAEGLNARDYGLFSEESDEKGNVTLGIRYAEALALECALQRRETKKLEERLKALEGVG